MVIRVTSIMDRRHLESLTTNWMLFFCAVAFSLFYVALHSFQCL